MRLQLGLYVAATVSCLLATTYVEDGLGRFLFIVLAAYCAAAAGLTALAVRR
jgi:hypothetical protein